MEKCPIYVLATNDGVSPIFESPLGLFDPVIHGPRCSRTATASRSAC